MTATSLALAMKALLVIGLVALAMFTPGCTTGSELTVPPTDAQGRYVIQATSSNTFSPEHAKVPVGATVVWKMASVHNVIAHDGSFESETLGAGETFEHTFDTAGKFGYHCSLHAGMDGSVTVE